MNPNAVPRLQAVRQTAASLIATPSNRPEACGAATDACPPARRDAPTLTHRLKALSAGTRDQPAPTTCQQRLWVSLFFDGTGNNLKADLPTMEHSNVARLFRAHQPDDDVNGVYRVYVPGIGTLFPEKGDSGQGPIPPVDTHSGMGAKGQARLDHAFETLSNYIAKAEARALNPTNKIVAINIAVFGFSRGATLARAFVRDLLSPRLRMTVIQAGEVRWRVGSYPLAIRFVGLWDTVASVGLPMSANNVGSIRSSRLATAGNLTRFVTQGLRTPFLRAVDLAFGAPGADPAPGSFDGHGEWADGLAIPPVVEHCVHMVAAHEIRNSFPVDSVLRSLVKPANCKEFIYPGAHSNVGGGYRPGEAGKGGPSQAGVRSADAVEALSLVTLRTMYDEARAHGVPLRASGGPQWEPENESDFDMSPALIDRFNHYLTHVGRGGRPLGEELLAHTRAYFAWRWWRIAKGRGAESLAVRENSAVFAQDRRALERQRQSIRSERAKHQSAFESAFQERTTRAAGQWQNPHVDLKALNADLADLNQRMTAAKASMARLEAQEREIGARLATLPNETELLERLNEYDRELLSDARSILAVIANDPERRRQLRPHYRCLIETYEAQFVEGRGLADEKIQAFFDNHVHDSLAGFGRDFTLPSDPRVVYVGSDRKLDYARSEDVGAVGQGALV